MSKSQFPKEQRNNSKDHRKWNLFLFCVQSRLFL